MRDLTISSQLARHARMHGERVALVQGSRQLTYRELDDRVGRLAATLRARGVRHGSRVAVLSPNLPEVLETYLAVARLGALSVPLNFRLTTAELGFLLADSGAEVVLVHESLASKVEGTERLVFGADCYAPVRAAEAEVSDVDAAFLMYTSGTTGRPKGAVLTHRNLLANTLAYRCELGGGPEDDAVWLAATPLFHIAALAGLLPTFLRGGRIVLAPPGKFDAAEVVDVMARERVTACFLVPTQWQEICALPEVSLPALRRVVWGAAAAPDSLVRTLAETFPHAELTTGLAQTECGPITTVARGPELLRKIGSVGRPMFAVEARVVDREMRDVPPGTVGEIVYRGPSVMREYWNRPEETAEAFRGGWFHSGDLVRMDEDGFCWLVDRMAGLIVSGGENVYCAEVENALAGHPGIGEVAVIGVPDPHWGEVPLAVITASAGQPVPTLEEIRAWCAPRIAGYKHPRRVEVAPELPRNATGKVAKALLRAEYTGS